MTGSGIRPSASRSWPSSANTGRPIPKSVGRPRTVAEQQRYGLRLITDVVTTAQLIAQWGDKCLDCTGKFEVIDHRLPVAAGGNHTVLNVVPCCRNCNARKRWTFDERIIRARREAWADQAARSHHGPPAQPDTVRAEQVQPPGSRRRS